MRVDLITPAEIGPAEEFDWARFQARERSIAIPSLSPGWARCVGAARPDARVAVISTASGRTEGFLPVQSGKGMVVEPLGASLGLGCGLVGDPQLAWGAAEWLRDMRARGLQFSGAPENQVEFARAARGGDLRMIVELHGGARSYLSRRRDQSDVDILERRAGRMEAVAKTLGAPQVRLFACDGPDFDQALYWSAGSFRRPQEDWEITALRDAFESDEEHFHGALFTLRANAALVAGAFFLYDDRCAQLAFYGEAPEHEGLEPAAVLLADAIAAFSARGLDEVDLGTIAGSLSREFSTRRRPALYGRIRPAERRRFPASIAAPFAGRATREARSWSHAGPAVH